MKPSSQLALALLVFPVILACVTINVYFPEAAVKDLSEQIEAAVAREAAKAQAGDPAEEPNTDGGESTEESQGFAGQVFSRHTLDRAIGTALHLLGPGEVYAQGDAVAAPEISNPAIRKIIQSRSQRLAALNGHKSSGVLGENNEALVEVRSLDNLPLKERAAVQKLVKAENADRERMFKEIAAATGTDLSQLPQIRATYATTLRESARAGDWVQGPDGAWSQKP